MIRYTLNTKAMDYYNNTMQGKAISMGCEYIPMTKDELETMFNELIAEALKTKHLKINPRGFAKLYIDDLKLTIDVTRNEIRWLDVWYKGTPNFDFAI